MSLLIAAPNSSERNKARADIVLSGPGHIIDAPLQAAADLVWQEQDEVVLLPGLYRIANTLHTQCAIRGVGDATLTWRGKAGAWMIEHQGVSGRIDPQDLTNLRLDGNGKARGILVNDVHRSVIDGLYCYAMAGCGLEVTNGWCLFIRNLTCNYGATPGVKLGAFAMGVLDGLTAQRLIGDAPVLDVWAGGDLRQIAVEGCQTGKSPTILLHEFNPGRLSGVRTERNNSTALVQVVSSSGARVERIQSWQDPTLPIPIIVQVQKSRNVIVDGVRAWNTSEAIVDVDCDSYEGGCRAENVREMYGENVNVQPKHIIRYAGRAG